MGKPNGNFGIVGVGQFEQLDTSPDYQDYYAHQLEAAPVAVEEKAAEPELTEEERRVAEYFEREVMLSLAEVCSLLNVGRTWVGKLIFEQRKLTGVRKGNRWYVPKSSLEAYRDALQAEESAQQESAPLDAMNARPAIMEAQL